MSTRDKRRRTKTGASTTNEFAEHETRPRILIIDDDPDILESLKDLIELSSGYDIDMALDADSALAAAAATPPSIAIIDVKLGVSDGIDLIPRLQRIDPKTICIVMTAYRDPSYPSRALESGANEFLYKPLDPEQMTNLLARLTRRDPSEGNQ